MAWNWKIVLGVIVILLLATFLRLYQLPSLPPGLYPDEAMNGSNDLEALRTHDFKVFYPENNGREGLFINIQAFFLKPFLDHGIPLEPWMLRFPSAIFGILTVLGIFCLTRELYGMSGVPPGARANRIALLAAFLLATLFWHINFSRIGFRAITAPFWLTWGFYLTLYTFRALRVPRPRLRWLLPVLSAVVYTAGFYSYIAFRATPLLFAVPAFWLLTHGYPKRRFWAITGLFVVTATVVMIPFLAYFTAHPADFFGRTSQISIFTSPHPALDLLQNIALTVGMFNIYGDGNWRHNIAGSPELYGPIGIFFLIGVALGVAALLRFLRRRKTHMEAAAADSDVFPFLLAFGWLVVAALPVVISNEGLPHALRSILLIPPAILLAALGGIRLFEFLKNEFHDHPGLQRMLQGGVVLVLAATALLAYQRYFIVWGQNPNVPGAFNQDYVDIAYMLRALPPDLPKYVVVQAGGVDVRGIPMPAETVMFLTQTFFPEDRDARNIHYVLPDQISSIPPGSFTVTLR